MTNELQKSLFDKLDEIINNTKPTHEERVCKLIWDLNMSRIDKPKIIFEYIYHAYSESGFNEYRLYLESKPKDSGFVFTLSENNELDDSHNFEQVYLMLTQDPTFNLSTLF